MNPTVVAIHLAKGSRLPMQSKDSVEVEAGKGIVGDRYHGTRHRHVSVQSRESLDEAAEVFGAEVASHLTRRNVTISHGVVPRDPGARTIFRVLEGGTISLGDIVEPVADPAAG